MKILILSILIAITASLTYSQGDVQQVQDNVLEERVFNQWLKKHKIDVPLDADLNNWKKNVIKNFREIEAHNARYRKGEEKFKKTLNFLSHLSTEEKRARLHGNLKIDPTKARDQAEVVDKALLKDFPDYFNWADKGVVQRVMYQGDDCGDCFIMAGIAAIEAHACIYNNVCEKLSEMDAIECTPNNCNGGEFYEAFNFTIQYGGAALEKDYPYPDGFGSASMNATKLRTCAAKTRPRVKGTQVIAWKSLPGDAETMRYYLVKQGPLYIPFQAYDNLRDWKPEFGIYNQTEGEPGGHGVLLTGYGTQNGMDYWIFKNSWSTLLGDEGYFKIQRGVNLAEFEKGYATYPIMDTSFTS